MYREEKRREEKERWRCRQDAGAAGGSTGRQLESEQNAPFPIPGAGRPLALSKTSRVHRKFAVSKGPNPSTVDL